MILARNWLARITFVLFAGSLENIGLYEESQIWVYDFNSVGRLYSISMSSDDYITQKTCAAESDDSCDEEVRLNMRFAKEVLRNLHPANEIVARRYAPDPPIQLKLLYSLAHAGPSSTSKPRNRVALSTVTTTSSCDGATASTTPLTITSRIGSTTCSTLSSTTSAA